MAIWFVDRASGNDANDGKSSVACSFVGKTLNYVFGTRTIVDETVASALAVGGVIYLTSATAPAQAAQFEVTNILGSIVTMELYTGTWVESSRTDTACSSGPVKEPSALTSWVVGDEIWLVEAGGLKLWKPRSQTVAVGTTPVTLKSLMAGAEFMPGIGRLLIQNLEAFDLYVSVSNPIPATAADMAIIEAKKVMDFEYQMSGCDLIYVAGSGPGHRLHVIQEGLGLR